MINRKELRIDNLVYREFYNPGFSKTEMDKELCIVEVIDRLSAIVSPVLTNYHAYQVAYTYLHAVPITTEILEKLKFKPGNILTNYWHNHVGIVRETGMNFHFFTDIKAEHYCKQVKSLHRLQNIYFEQTDKELLWPQAKRSQQAQQ